MRSYIVSYDLKNAEDHHYRNLYDNLDNYGLCSFPSLNQRGSWPCLRQAQQMSLTT